MAFTTDDLDRVKRAIGSSELTVRFADGKSVTYRSMEELLRAKAEIERELSFSASAAGADWPSRRKIIRYSSGIL